MFNQMDDNKKQVVETTDTTTTATTVGITQEQVDKIISERLERERAKLLKQQDEAVKKAQEEAERLAKLSADEREKEVLTRTQQELEAKSREIAMRENKLSAIEKLSEAGVPLKLVDFVVTDSPEKTTEAVGKLIETYQEAVAEGVALKLRGNPPKDVNTRTAPKEDKLRRVL